MTSEITSDPTSDLTSGLTSGQAMKAVDRWVGQGWLRELDRAFVRFLQRQEPQAHGWALLAAALTSYQQGRGHICLDLGAVKANPVGILGLPVDRIELNKADSPASLLSKIGLRDWEREIAGSGLAAAGEGDTPLVFRGGRLYLRRYWQYERDVARKIELRLQQAVAVPDDLSQRVDALFADRRDSAESQKREVHWQSVAAAMAAGSAISVISGGPGTGKTTTVVRLLGVLLQITGDQGGSLRIGLAAPTGKAAARLSESILHSKAELTTPLRAQIPEEAVTLHRLLGGRPDTRRFIHHHTNPLHLDLLVVDEASMIDLEMMAAVMDALPDRARLVLIGDKDQLSSVEAGAVLGDFCKGAGAGYRQAIVDRIRHWTRYDLSPYGGAGSDLNQHTVVLQKNYRFGAKSGIGVLAKAVNSGDVDNLEPVLTAGHGDIAWLAPSGVEDTALKHLILDGNPQTFDPISDGTGPVGYRAFFQRVHAGPRPDESEVTWMRAVLGLFGRFRMVAAIRRGPWGVAGLNAATEEIIYGAGLIDDHHQAGDRAWYAGRPVMITRNDYALGLMNGDIGITLPITREEPAAAKVLKVVFPTGRDELKTVSPARLGELETVYAQTVHKSQGAEFAHTALVLPDRPSPVITRELLYTAITRAQKWFTLVSPDKEVLLQAIPKRTYRASGLGELLHRKKPMPR